MAGDFASLNRKLEAVSRDLSGTTSRAQMKRVGVKVQPLIDRAVTSSIGDLSMSGWRRGAPIQIKGTSRTTSDHAVLVEPVKSAKGPMAVLERGRNMGNASGMAGPGVSADGTTRRNKNGSVRKVRARKSKRWNGYTPAKHTMTDASQLIKDKAPGLIADELHKSLAKHLMGG